MHVTAILADAAAVGDGKLYIHGGGWDRLFTPAFPTTHPSLAVAIHIGVEYDEALADHQLDVYLVDTDGNRLGPGAQGTFNAGHPAGALRGAKTSVPLALTFPGVTIEAPGMYEWIVEIDGEQLAWLPMHVMLHAGAARPA